MPMKQELRQIYDDLSHGKLTEKETLEKIRAAKLRGQGEPTGPLLLTPVWQTKGVPASHIDYTDQHVVLCDPKVDLEKLETALPHSQLLSLHAGQEGSIAQWYSDCAVGCFERIRAVLRSKPQGNVLVQIVVAGDREQALLAGLSGLLKTAALENPQFIGQLILVPAETTGEELAAHLQAERSDAPEPMVRYEHGARQVLRWQETAADHDKPPVAFKEDGVYLITGGLGGLGVLFAKEILEQTSGARVVLTGRSALTGESQARFDGLSGQAGRVSYRQVDVGDLDQVERLIAAIKQEYRQLDGILHCAGMIADQFILKKSGAEFREVLAPKVAGTFNLDQASRDVELDFFVLFSSIAGAMGNPGQADYAAANGFLDQFAAYRNRQVAVHERHGRTRSIDWPLWEAGGMGIDAASQERLQQMTGMRPMRTATGLEAFYRSLALPYDQMLVVEGDLTQIRRALLAGPAMPDAPQDQQTVAAAGIDSESLREKTQHYLRKQFSELLKLPAHKIDPQAALEKYGIDSILAMKLTNQLEKTFGSPSKTL